MVKIITIATTMGVFRESFSHIRKLPPAFWIVIAATLINQMGNMAFVFLVLYLTQHAGYSLAQASFAFATFSASMLVSGLCGGSAIDKFGATPVMIVTLLINSVVLLIFPLATAYLFILSLCVLWGAAFGLFRPASSTLISHLSTAGLHKITFSVFRLAINLGMSVGPAVGGYLAYYSFNAIFITNGIANALGAVILLLGLWSTVWLRYRPTQTTPTRLFNIKWLKEDKALRLLVIGMIPVAMVFFQYESTMAVFLSRDLHFALSFYGLLFTLNTILIVLFELPLNIITLNWSYRINFMLGAVFLTAGFFGMLFAETQGYVIFLAVLWTIGEMLLFPAANSYIADIAPAAERGSYMSLFSTASNVGMLLGPWLGAIVMEKWGANGLWIACGVWGLLSVYIFHYQPEPKNRERSPTA